MLQVLSETDPMNRARLQAFHQELERQGWVEGKTLRIDYRWAAGQLDRLNALARELVELRPDVIVSGGSSVAASALLRETTSIPIIFVQVPDPVTLGLVKSLARPGGNITGFTNYDFSVAGKWVELVKDLDPYITKVIFIAHPQSSTAIASFVSAFEEAGRALGITPSVNYVDDVPALERTMTGLSKEGRVGLVVGTGFFSSPTAR
jgi:putative ABC transport system substrate-binding protein